MLNGYEALCIDQSHDAARTFLNIASTRFKLTDPETATNLHEALQTYIEGRFHICFISETIPLKDLQLFFTDVLRANQKQGTIFVQYRKKPASDDELKSLMRSGFNTAISIDLGPRDLRLMEDALVHITRSREISQRVEEIDEAVRIALRELDLVASERKRGWNVR